MIRALSSVFACTLLACVVILARPAEIETVWSLVREFVFVNTIPESAPLAETAQNEGSRSTPIQAASNPVEEVPMVPLGELLARYHDGELQDAVDATRDGRVRVTEYTGRGCGYCTQIATWMETRGVVFRKIDASRRPRRDDGPRGGVPVIRVDVNGEHAWVRGADEDRLRRVLIDLAHGRSPPALPPR